MKDKVNRSDLTGKRVALFCLGMSELDAANALRTAGVEVIIGIRDMALRKEWERAGFAVYDFWEASKRADIVQIW